MLRLAGVALLAFGVAAQAQGQCVISPLEHYLADEHVTAVLKVRVLSVQSVVTGQVAVAEVLRLWKGETSRRLTIYSWRPSDIHEGEELRGGEEFLVIAHRLSATERAESGVQGGEPALGTANCLVYRYGPWSREILGDASGYPPK
jgi:hypothetical protein